MLLPTGRRNLLVLHTTSKFSANSPSGVLRSIRLFSPSEAWSPTWLSDSCSRSCSTQRQWRVCREQFFELFTYCRGYSRRPWSPSCGAYSLIRLVLSTTCSQPPEFLLKRFPGLQHRLRHWSQ